MKKLTMLAVLTMVAVLMTGCGETHDSLMKKTIDTMEEMTEVMATIQDKESAEKAAPKLEKLGEKLEALGEKAEELGEPDQATQDKLQEKYGKRMEEVGMKFVGQMFRIGMDPELNAVLEEAMPDMEN
jgi:molybdopterin converting factor small subunit